MSDGAGQCRQRHLWSVAASSCLMVLAIACFFFAAPRPTPAVGPDLLHEEMGVDYDELAAGVQAAYAQARSRTLEASRILFPDDGDEYAPDALNAAMSLYEDSVALIHEIESKYSQAFEKIPLLFVQLEYLVVRNLSGMAAILSLRGDLNKAHDMRTTLIGRARESRARIAFAIERNILPQFQGQYIEVDDSFRQLLAESYVWMGVDAETIGNVDDARTNYTTAIELSDHPDSQEAIRVLLKRLKFMHERTVLTAGGEKSAPALGVPPAADGLGVPPAAEGP